MFNFGKDKNLGKLKVLLDIRSSSIGGAVLVQFSNEKPKIIYSTREYLFLENNKNITTEILSSFDKVLVRISTDGLLKNAEINSENRVSEVLCMFSSPWYKSKIQNFNFKDKKEIKFSKSFLNKLFEKEKSRSNAENVGSKNKIIESVIEQDILSVFLNGYEVLNPFNKSANEITLSLYSGIISKKFQEKVEDKIKEKLNPRKISLHTHPTVIISVIKRMFKNVNNFLFFDIAGETTEIGIYRDSALQKILNTPIGNNFIIKTFINNFSVDKSDALNQINLAYETAIDDKNIITQKNAVKKVEEKFTAEMIAFMDKKLEKEITPPTIFVTADFEIAPLLKQVLNSREFYMKALKINREPVVNFINPQSMRDLADFSDGVKKDPLLSILANFSTVSSY